MWIRQYLIGVTAATLICGIIRALFPDKGTIGTVIKTLLGIAMILVAVGPWTSVSVNSLYTWKEDISFDAQNIVRDAEDNVKEETRQRITEQVRSYILVKTDSLGAQVDVQVDVSNGEMPVPCAVKIVGAVSPYAKQVISQMLTSDLGIDKEAQIWIS